MMVSREEAWRGGRVYLAVQKAAIWSLGLYFIFQALLLTCAPFRQYPDFPKKKPE
jgi:hypothetical protein